MSIEKERKAFDAWHFKHWKLNCAYSESIEDAKILYDRVYSHAHSAGERERGFMAWQASSNREGYKLVPVDSLKEIIECAYCHIHDRCVGDEGDNVINHILAMGVEDED